MKKMPIETAGDVSKNRSAPVKEIILLTLGQNWPLSVKDLHEKVMAHRPDISYHAVHKAVHQLYERDILSREGKGYRINPKWLETLANLIESIRTSYVYSRPIHLPGLKEFKEEGDVQTFIFENLAEAENYRKRLQWEYLMKKGNNPPYCAIAHHLRSPLVVSEKSLSILNAAANIRSKAYVLVSGKSPIDEWCADYYRNENTFVKTGVDCAQNCETMILGDIVTQLYIPRQTQAYIDSFYQKFVKISDVNPHEFYTRAYLTPIDVKFVVIKNPSIANHIRTQIMSNFQRNRLAVFDVGGVLIGGFAMADFAEYLAIRDSFNEESLKQIHKLKKDFTSGALPYDTYSPAMLENYAKGLEDIQTKKISEFARDFVAEGGVSVFGHSRRLFNLVRSHMQTLAVTKMPHEIVDALRNTFSFDAVITSSLEIKDGRYTGKILTNMAETKVAEKVFKAWLSTNRICLDGSLGFGDGEHDISFLSSISKPYVVNPARTLLAKARQKGWPVFTNANSEKLIQRIQADIEAISQTSAG